MRPFFGICPRRFDARNDRFLDGARLRKAPAEARLSVGWGDQMRMGMTT
jgi:hypothetical protein